VELEISEVFHVFALTSVLQEMTLEDFIFSHPAQIALLGVQYQWTMDTQSALASAKSDKGIMNRNMKKTDAILR
jgi:dynein heavy chain